MEELHCAQLQRTSTLRLISSVTNGLSFAFLRQLSPPSQEIPSVRGIVQTLPVPTPKVTPGDEPTSLDTRELNRGR